MSSELLRRAAALMRERAEAANDGPWTCNEVADPPEFDDYGYGGEVRSPTLGHGEQDDLIASMVDHADAAHIASWHPAVALAVADLLDDGAAYLEYVAAEHADKAHGDEGKFFLAVARAYLGERP